MRKKLLFYSLLLHLDPLFFWDASISITDTIVLASGKCCLYTIGIPRTYCGRGKNIHDRAMETHKIDLALELEILLAKDGMLRKC